MCNIYIYIYIYIILYVTTRSNADYMFGRYAGAIRYFSTSNFWFSFSHYRTVKRSIAMEDAPLILLPKLRRLVMQHQNAATKMYREDKNLFPRHDANVQQGMANFDYAKRLYFSSEPAQRFVADYNELMQKSWLGVLTPEDLYTMGALYYILDSCIRHRGEQSRRSSPSSSSASASSWDSTGKPLTTK